MRISKSAFILILVAHLFATAIISSKVAEATATNATRIPFGTYFQSRSTNPLPSGQPGEWNSGGTMNICNTSGSCYAEASPVPSPTATSVDAGATVGSAAGTKLDTCSAGNQGGTCYTQKDVITVMKQLGFLAF